MTGWRTLALTLARLAATAAAVTLLATAAFWLALALSGD